MDGDVSDSAHVVASNGDPQIGTTTAKFDGATYFDGSGDYLIVSQSDDFDFGSGDFTIDFWVNMETESAGSPGPGHMLLAQYINEANRITIGINNTSDIISVGRKVSGGWLGDLSWSYTFTIGTWYHIAISRDGGTVNIFINGEKQVTSYEDSDPIFFSTAPLYIGYQYYSEIHWYNLRGHMDELRISKGIARWTSNFTPESGPYTE